MVLSVPCGIVQMFYSETVFNEKLYTELLFLKKAVDEHTIRVKCLFTFIMHCEGHGESSNQMK